MKKNLDLISKLSLTAGIISIVLAVPVIGTKVNIFNIPRIALIVLAIIILVKIKGTDQPKNAAILGIISNVMAIIASFIMLTVAAGASAAALADYANEADAAATALGGVIGGGIIGSIFAFPAWILLILSAIFYMINYGKAKKASEAMIEDTTFTGNQENPEV